MNKKQAKKLFKKYTNNECSLEEKEMLHSFLDSYQNRNKTHNWNEGEIEEMWLKIMNKIENKGGSVKRFRFQSILKYAAIFVGILGLTIIYTSNYQNKESIGLSLKDETIILKMSNNKTKKINLGTNQSILNEEGDLIGTHNGNQLVYSKAKIKKLVYNEIQVPNGKKFKLVLSDGTLVHINSGTKLKYPVNFIKGVNREVFLEGEAYFEVAKYKDHPFIVNANNFGVQVLGTHFNINSYKETNAFAVLLEGSVEVYKKGVGSEIITPGQKAALEQGRFKISEIDVNDYVAWRQGNLVFNDEYFVDIIEKIKRKYNVDFQSEYQELNNVKFRGRFGDETILDVLNVFKESAGFDFKIVENQIIITKPNIDMDN